MTRKTTKKRLWLILSLFIVIILPLTFYLTQDNYEEGTPEQLRRLWNLSIANNQEKEGPKLEESIENLKKNSPESHNQIIYFAEKNNLQWQVEIPEETDISLLPLEGLTESELFHLAYEHQHPGACLKMGTKKHRDYAFYSILIQKKWFSRARDLGRPGAGFLLSVVTEQENLLPGFQPSPWQTSDARYIEQLPGYPQFRHLILQGDFELYQTLTALDPNADTLGLQSGLSAALKTKAEQGDPTAQRQLGQLGLSKRTLIDDIHTELNRPRGPIILFLAKWINIDTKVNKSPSRDQALQSLEWLRKAADQGDLQAMYLWSTNAFGLYPHYDRKTWNTLFTYWDRLLQAGHREAMHHVNLSGLLGIRENLPSNITWLIIESKYTHDEIKRISEQIRVNLLNRNKKHRNHLSIGELLGQKELNNIFPGHGKATDPHHLFPYSVARIPLSVITRNRNNPSEIIHLFQNMADQGEPVAQYLIADAILKKSTTDQNILQARDLLEKAWPAIQKYNTRHRTERTPTPQNRFPFYYLSTAKLVFDRLIHLYITPGSPAYSPRKAFVLADQYLHYQDPILIRDPSSLKNQGKPHLKNAHYYIGLMHERGLGTPQNTAKALSHYRQGAAINEIKSIHALARCHQLGLGTPQNTAEAINLYQKTTTHDDGELEPNTVLNAERQLDKLTPSPPTTP